MGSTPVTHFHHTEGNNDHYLRCGLSLSTVHASMWQSHNSRSSGALDRFQGPTCRFFFSPPAEALGKIQTPLKSIIQAGGELLSHVSDHVTVTKVQTDDGSDNQRQNISLGGRSLMSSREYSTKNERVTSYWVLQVFVQTLNWESLTLSFIYSKSCERLNHEFISDQ